MSKIIRGDNRPSPQGEPNGAAGYTNAGAGNVRQGGGRWAGQTEASARNEAQRIIQEAADEAARIRAQAEEYRQRGYDEGYAEGVQQAQAEWTETILRLNRENEAKFRFFENDLVKLSLRISEKIIGEQLRIEPSSVTQIVAKALEAVRHQREIYLRVNPDEYELINENKYLLLEQLSRANDIDIRPDPDVAKGGCRIESETGTIEANLEKQLTAMEKILLGE